MTRRHAPQLALALLERLVPDSEPVAGDLVEESNDASPWFGSGCRCCPPLRPPHWREVQRSAPYGSWTISPRTRWNGPAA